MKFSVERAILLKALAHAQSVVEKRNTIPILANILLDARDGALRLTATDMEIAIVEEVPGVQVARPGRTTAPAATLFEIVRKLPDGATVELDHKGGDAPLALRAGRFQTSLQVLPAWASQTEVLAGFSRFLSPDMVLREDSLARDLGWLAEAAVLAVLAAFFKQQLHA